MGAPLRNGLIFAVLYAMLWGGMHLLGIDPQQQTLGLLTFAIGWFGGLITGLTS